MIFEGVKEVKSENKAFFLEKIDVYCRIVEVCCEINNTTIKSSDLTDVVISEMIDIGVIKNKEDVEYLAEVVGNNYRRFVNCVSFAVNNQNIIGNLLDNLSNKKRSIIQKKEANEKPTLVDFFCGAGGLSLGFIQNGFHVVLANDIEDVCIATYKYNHPEVPSSAVIKGDIKNIVDNIEDYHLGDVDVVVGGPPCQGFSEANRQRIINDPRNQLYKYFIQAVSKIVPKFVVMENVKGMLKVANQVVEDYENLEIEKGGHSFRYKVAYRILNSSDFNVAQSRERLIYIAVRDDISEKNNITPNIIFELITSRYHNSSPFLLSDALKDIKPLEAPRTKNQNEIDSPITGKKIDVNIYADSNNKYLEMINMGRKIPLAFNHKARYVSDLNYEIYKRLNPGDDATDEKIKDIMPYAHRNHCFKDKYYKLIPDRPCRTITAHLRMDCHSHIHPTQIRSLTPREAARVQSFPDDYLFLGAYLKTYMQIGNAVPPVMARGIAAIIKECL